MKTLKYSIVFMAIVAAASLIITSCEDEEMPPVRNLIYEETFEGPEPFATAYNKEVGDWDYALQFVGDTIYKGKVAARFEIRHDQPLVADGKRSEVSIVRGVLGQITNNTWYSFAVYFPSEGFEYDTKHDVISQWYQAGSPVRLLTVRDKIVLEVGSDPINKKEFEVAELKRNKWNTFVFHIIHSHYDDGLIVLWHNGIRKVAYRGPNMYDDMVPKWQIGINKISFEEGTSMVTKRIIYFDNIKVGNENAVYTDMIPRR